jgi:hypothetical protein
MEKNSRLPELLRERDLVRRLLEGTLPAGRDFDACRAVMADDPEPDTAFHALTMLLEGALADPRLAIDDTQVLVPLIKGLARGRIRPQDLA